MFGHCRGSRKTVDKLQNYSQFACATGGWGVGIVSISLYPWKFIQFFLSFIFSYFFFFLTAFVLHSALTAIETLTMTGDSSETRECAGNYRFPPRQPAFYFNFETFHFDF